jgi:hypothetical protein
MIRFALATGLVICATGISAQAVSDAVGGEVRVLDRTNGTTTDLTLRDGETKAVGHLSITLHECRFPTDNPAGNAYGELTIIYQDLPEPVFQGWMIASAPALNAMDHPRYDVWMLRCITS